jgi:dTDP-4-amino-4,6-dideoxygalactose transaminase
MINTSVPYLIGNEKKYLNECIKENYVSAVGKFIIKFENKFKKIYKYNYVAAVSSGTAALHLSLKALGVKKNDLIILPSYTFAATANAILYCQAKPWFFDISRDNLTIDLDKVEKTLKKKTFIKKNICYLKKTKQIIRGIIPVFTFGLCPDLKKLEKLSKKYHLKVLLDGAAAHGATFRNRMISRFNFTTCYSFNGNKTFTCGGGGIIATNNNKIFNMVKTLSNVGKRKNSYKLIDVGFNYRINNIQAAIGLAQLEKFKEILNRKKNIFLKYTKSLSHIKIIQIPKKQYWQSGISWAFFYLLNNERNINKNFDFLNKENIESKYFWIPLHLQKPYLKFTSENMQFTNYFWKRTVVLPSSSGITNNLQLKIINKVKKFLESI